MQFTAQMQSRYYMELNLALQKNKMARKTLMNPVRRTALLAAVYLLLGVLALVMSQRDTLPLFFAVMSGAMFTCAAGMAARGSRWVVLRKDILARAAAMDGTVAEYVLDEKGILCKRADGTQTLWFGWPQVERMFCTQNLCCFVTKGSGFVMVFPRQAVPGGVQAMQGFVRENALNVQIETSDLT